MNNRIADRSCLRRTQLCVCLVATVLLVIQIGVTLAWFSGQLHMSTFIAVASLAVALAALEVGVWMLPPTRAESTEVSAESGASFVNAFLAGTIVRMAGTIALLVFCRYEFGLATETPAAFLVAWYVILTFADVCILAWLLRPRAKTTRDNVPQPRHETAVESSRDGTTLSPDSRA